jgi:hypothetical protein
MKRCSKAAEAPWTTYTNSAPSAISIRSPDVKGHLDSFTSSPAIV